MTAVTTMTPQRHDCPYGADQCPKISDLEESIKDLAIQMKKVTWYLAIIMGIIAVECGYVII